MAKHKLNKERKNKGRIEIIECYKKFVASEGKDQSHLKRIQEIVNEVGDIFELKLPSKENDGIPRTIIFKPQAN